MPQNTVTRVRGAVLSPVLPVADPTSTPDTHVMKIPAHDQRPCPYQRSVDATTPGDTTPRIINNRGKKSHRVWRP